MIHPKLKQNMSGEINIDQLVEDFLDFDEVSKTICWSVKLFLKPVGNRDMTVRDLSFEKEVCSILFLSYFAKYCHHCVI